jgi:heme A synthase
MKHLHSTLAIVLLLALVVAIIITLANYAGNKPYNRKIALIGLISAHLQLVIGLVLYFVSPLGIQSFSGENMGNILSRLYFIEHPLMMILAIVLITVCYSKSKKMTDSHKANKTVLIFYIIGLIFVLSRIPWNTWSLLN